MLCQHLYRLCCGTHSNFNAAFLVLTIPNGRYIFMTVVYTFQFLSPTWNFLRGNPTKKATIFKAQRRSCMCNASRARIGRRWTARANPCNSSFALLCQKSVHLPWSHFGRDEFLEVGSRRAIGSAVGFLLFPLRLVGSYYSNKAEVSCWKDTL